MPPVNPIVYVDTNVVIEAHRVRCWQALATRYHIHTTRECWRELGRGDSRDPDYVPVDLVALAKQVTVHDVTTVMLAVAATRAPQCALIDRGERDLLAWVAGQKGQVLLLTTADRAAVKAACQLGLDSRLVALEDLMDRVGAHPALKNWFRKGWLSHVKTEALLEGL